LRWGVHSLLVRPFLGLFIFRDVLSTASLRGLGACLPR
jgi:hypothetical protein